MQVRETNPTKFRQKTIKKKVWGVEFIVRVPGQEMQNGLSDGDGLMGESTVQTPLKVMPEKVPQLCTTPCLFPKLAAQAV